MGRWKMVGLRLVVGGLCSLMVAAQVQAQAFRVARAYSLSGSSESAFPVQAVLADFGSPGGPKDGHLDVVAVQQNQVAALLYGAGDGRFPSAGRTTDVMDIPTAVVAGDFNRDGLTDIAVTGTSKSLQWFRATGEQMTPFVATGAPVDLDESPIGAAVGLLNEDANLDIAVLNDDGSGGTVQVLLGNGDGTFTVFGEPFAAGPGVSAIAIADLTGDGVPDVAISSAVTNSVAVLRNNGTGFLLPPGTQLSVGLEPVALATADLNGDERTDIVSANRSSDSVSVLLANLAGGFAAAQDYATGGIGSFASGVAVGDFDKDGRSDLMIANNRSSDVGVLRGDGNGNFGELSAYIADQEPIAVLAADLDGDGNDEAISLNFGDTSPTVAVVMRRADSKVAAIENIITPVNPVMVASGDIDADGLCDFVVTHRQGEIGAEGFVEVYRSPANGGGPRAVQQLAVTQPGNAARGDLNGDGVLDLVILNEVPNELVVFLGRRAGGFQAATRRPLGEDTTAIVVGDWNGDGRDDVAVSRLVPAASAAAEPTGEVEVRLATASGLGNATAIQVSPSAVDLGSGDFNGDGRLDLFVASGSTVGSLILLGNGNGGFAAAGPAIAGTSLAQAVAVADYDRDGNDDVALLSASSDRKVVVSFGDGAGLFPARREAGTFDGPAAVVARDVTNDGVPDLVVADQASSNAVWVARSLGSQRRFSLTSFGVSRQPNSVTTGDFDGDGRYDMAALTTFVAAVGVISNDAMASVVRGDGNNDTTVSAADVAALMRETAEGGTRRVEDVGRGAFAGSPGLDANGDGAADRLDTLALVHRLFL